MIELEAQNAQKTTSQIDKQIGHQLSFSLYLDGIMGVKWDLDEDFYDALRDVMLSSLKYDYDFS